MISPLGHDALVGRSEVLAHLMDLAVQAALGQGSVIVVTGEAGIGKSRVCREVATRVRPLGFDVAEARCWAHGGAPPLWPWREILRQVDPANTPPPPGAPRVTLSGWPGLDTGFGVFEGSADRLRFAGERAPLLVILDDLHEADEGTLLLSRFLASQAHSIRVVVLATIRSGAVAPGSREAYLLHELEQTATVVELPGLGLDALAELVASTGRPADPTTVDLLAEVTKGNPLVAQSVLRAAPPGPLDDTLALGVGEAVHRRLASVDPAVTAILARAAVLGIASSPAEVAALCGCAVADVRAAAQIGLSLQLLRTASADELVFTHDLVREAVEATLASSERDDAHAAAARLILDGDASGDAGLRAVRHALEVAGRSSGDLHDAITLARVAAGSLIERDAFNDAAALMGDVIDVVARAGGTAPAALRIDLAHAVLVAGRLGEAHRLYVDAVQAAEAEGDPVLRAEAAAGLGGIWINNVRSPVEQARILRLQRDAVAALPAGFELLALRLRSRISSGAVFWEGAAVEPLLTVVAEARALGDPTVTLEVLSNVHTALLGPDWGRLRLELADEMIALAGDVSGGIFALMARCWRAIDLFLIGSDEADSALAELRGPAETLQCLSVLYVVRLIETMLLIRAGRLTEAEELAQVAFGLGQQAQDADALAYYGIQLLAIRWLQGRDAEMLELFEQIAGSENVIRGDQSFNAVVAAVAARSGQLDTAQRYLARVLDPPGLDGLHRFSTWLATVVAVVETATALGHDDTAASAYDRLVPYARLPIMPSLAVVCFGSTHLPLGQAARTTGKLDLAVEQFEAAVAANIRLGNLPRAALARIELAITLQARGGPGDLAVARRWVDEAIDAGRRLGLTELTERWQALRATLSDLAPVDTMEPDVVPVSSDRALDSPRSAQGLAPVLTIDRHDRTWVIEHAGDRLVLPDRVGLRYLAELVHNPGRSITARHLVGGDSGGARAVRQPLLDRTARDALEDRARQLAEQIADARARDDVEGQARFEDELDAIANELRSATGLAHRDRFFDDDAERARTAVRKAVVRAINEVAAGLPAAGAHLRGSITTGVECRYDPAGPPPVVAAVVDLRDEQAHRS